MSKLQSFLSKYFYFCMSLLIAVVVVYGFGHTVNDNLIHATPPRPFLLWCHGAAFSFWVVFFIVQSGLVRVRKVSIHRTLGWFGLALGIAMVVLGYTTAVTMAKYRVAHPGPFGGSPAAFLIVPFHDITTFAILFTLAIWYRKKPELHRRFIFIASCAITAAAFGRFPWIPDNWFDCGVDALVFLGVVRDWIVMKRVHPIYLWALPLMVIAQTVQIQIVIHHPAAWMAIAHCLMR